MPDLVVMPDLIGHLSARVIPDLIGDLLQLAESAGVQT